MTSLGSILWNAASGVQTSQTALQVVSTNVDNVNTPGYVATEVNQASLVAGAAGAGVTVADIQRITNSYLEAASLKAGSDSAAASAVEGVLTQAQSLFGDPSASGSVFSNLDGVFSAFSALATNPSGAASASALAAVSQFFSQTTGLAGSLSGLSSTADGQIQSDVSTVNSLLGQISALNATISQATAAGQDATGAQNQQSQLVTQLSGLMNVRTVPTALGGVQVLSGSGQTLVGTDGAASLAYSASGAGGAFTLTDATGVARAFDGQITSGAIGGLVRLRNVDLPNLQSQLAALATGAAAALNQVHNAHTSATPPNVMAGQSTGLDLPTVVGDFSGQTTIALLNGSNAVAHTVTIDFTGQTLSVDGGAPTSFTGASFLTALNGALAAAGGGSASYADGALTLTAGAGQGLAVQDGSPPAQDGGKGFSQFFGLNNLVSSPGVSSFATGLKSTDPSGFPAGQQVTLRVSDASGARLADVTVTTPGGTMAQLLTSLNATPGLGAFGAFSLSASGTLTFTPSTPGAALSVVSDGTSNTAAGVSLTALFGIGAAAQSAAGANLAVNPALAANPSALATATLNLGAAAGAAAVEPGDASGADALGQAGLTSLAFPAVPGLAASTTTLSNYAASIAAAVGAAAAQASTAKSQAQAVAASAGTALSSVEGVNLDQEMVNLTTYQQAYNASARMVQAASQLFTTLMNMTN